MLKYLFRCQFNDGEVFNQTQEDKSKLIEGGSAFTDVLKKQEVEGKKLESFYLESNDDSYGVNLGDGCFTVNGKTFFMHEQTVDKSKKLTNFRLIYFRRNTVSINFKVTEKELKKIPFKEIDGKLVTEYTSTIYLLGWQANYPDGSNHKQIMYIR